MKSTVAALTLLALGCAAEAPSDEGVDSANLETRTRVLLVPKSEGARIACREASLEVYCSESAARMAVGRCVTQAGESGMEGVSLDVRSGRCRTGERLYPTAASCKTPVPMNCGFYAGCVERSLPCGEHGYALDFGERFCGKFRSADLSERGTAWMKQAMKCLQTTLLDEIPTAFAPVQSRGRAQACEELSAAAFASHPRCYTAPENSICFLPPADLAVVLETIGEEELWRSRTSSQVLSTIGICTSQVMTRLLGFHATQSASRGRVEDTQRVEELEELQAFWESQRVKYTRVPSGSTLR